MLALRILRGLRIRRAPITGEIFYSLREAKVLIVQLRVHYNSVRPHRALLYRPPCAGKHRPDGPESRAVLATNPDHPMGHAAGSLTEFNR